MHQKLSELCETYSLNEKIIDCSISISHDLFYDTDIKNKN